MEIAESEELEPVSVAAEELPEIVPGLAVPESPALPESDSSAEVEEAIAAKSVNVATPVETIATPE